MVCLGVTLLMEDLNIKISVSEVGLDAKVLFNCPTTTISLPITRYL